MWSCVNIVLLFFCGKGQFLQLIWCVSISFIISKRGVGEKERISQFSYIKMCAALHKSTMNSTRSLGGLIFLYWALNSRSYTSRQWDYTELHSNLDSSKSLLFKLKIVNSQFLKEGDQFGHSNETCSKGKTVNHLFDLLWHL